MEKAARILLDQIGPPKQCGEDTWAGFCNNSVIHRVDERLDVDPKLFFDPPFGLLSY